MENTMNKNNELEKRMFCCPECNSSFALNSKNFTVVDADINSKRTQYEEFCEVCCPSCDCEFDVTVIYNLEVKEIEYEGQERKMGKTIIHETNIHGCGVILHNGELHNYSYDDGYFGDVKTTLKAFADIGIINLDNFIFLEEDEIYHFLQELMEEENEQFSSFILLDVIRLNRGIDFFKFIWYTIFEIKIWRR